MELSAAVDCEIERPARSRSLPLRLFALIPAALWCAWFVATAHSWSLVGLLATGLALGMALFYATFGFSTAWRRLILLRRGRALRAQMVMLGLACCLFFPALTAGEVFGISVAGYLRPMGWSIIAGAFLFGLGMQLGDGCASGNLYHAGGGRIKALPSMIGFTAGAFYATFHYEWWTTLKQVAPVSVLQELGLYWSLASYLLLFAALAWFSRVLERRRHGALEADGIGPGQGLGRHLWRGPWPLWWGALALAVLNFATLLQTGRPWSVAVAYPLWGARLSQWLGLDIEFDFSLYWMQPGRDDALWAPLLQDASTVMNIGILLGALLAAILGNRLKIEWRIPWQHWLAAVLGGLLMGYGATIGFGCNIGAFFSGIVSGSLHGWLWLACALAGSVVGVLLRPLFKLSNEKA